MKTINDYADLVKEQHALNTTIAPVETDLTSASKAYAVGQKFIYDGVLYQAKTAIAQGAALVLNTNYEAADDVSSEIQTLTNNVDVLIENGAVNKLPNNATTQTITGIQITVNADKSMTISGGGNSAAVDIFNDANNPIIISEDCKFSCGATFTLSTCEIVATATDNTTYSLKLSAGNSITIPAGKNIKKVTWYNNASYDETLTIYPMIADTDYTGGYVPYAMTNRELTDNVVVKNVTITPETGVTIDYNGTHKIGNLVILNFRFILDAGFSVATDAPIATIDAPPLGTSILAPAAMAWDGEVGGLLGIMTNNIIKLATSAHFVAGKSYVVNATYVCA